MDRFEITAAIITGIILFGLFTGVIYSSYKLDIWRSSCSQVYIDGKLEYSGKTKFYQTESRGSATIYKEYQQKFILPKQTKEIMSDKVKIINSECNITQRSSPAINGQSII